MTSFSYKWNKRQLDRLMIYCLLPAPEQVVYPDNRGKGWTTGKAPALRTIHRLAKQTYQNAPAGLRRTGVVGKLYQF